MRLLKKFIHILDKVRRYSLTLYSSLLNAALALNPVDIAINSNESIPAGMKTPSPRSYHQYRNIRNYIIQIIINDQDSELYLADQYHFPLDEYLTSFCRSL